jgi:hypothetical protein
MTGRLQSGKAAGIRTVPHIAEIKFTSPRKRSRLTRPPTSPERAPACFLGTRDATGPAVGLAANRLGLPHG